MKRFLSTRVALGVGVSALACGMATFAASRADAQTATGSIRGQVRNAAGAAVAGATVTAVNPGTNQTYRATTDPSGRYALNGLRPATYNLTITGGEGGATFNRQVTIAVGQVGTVDAVLGAPAAAAPGETQGEEIGAGAAAPGDIVVTGTRLAETRTSEVATNISQTQIRTLPQTDRNFLSFAALAPGVRYNDSETDKGIQSGASTASQVNVFVDGVSLKNKLREGGIAGQQNSRGNPFGQLAVQEFRVLTQNYKAEYEQAGSAIITSVTKSGTNEFHGEVFGQYTDRALTSPNVFDERAGRPKPAFERKQYGAALGGPIIKDKLFFFLTYEGNDQDRAFAVDSTGSAAAVAEFEQFSGRRLADFEGNFVSPFRGDFYFGKLTFTPDDNQVFDLSYSRREETDIQGFGGNTSFEFAENKVNTVDTYLGKWTYTGEDFTNEFNVNYLNYVFNPTSLNPDLATFNYDGTILFGGRESTRRETQQSWTIRDDVTWTRFDDHVIKVGARVELTDIEFINNLYVQPSYIFRRDTTNNTDFSFPAEARLGFGNGRIFGSNTQLGFYAQDDWDVTDKLQLNIGLRYDYETNGFNNNFRTNSRAAAALRSLPATAYFDPENYISTGSNRTPFKYAFAPRFGFSYDVNDNQSTVIFGGFGRYYDRNNFNNTVDEVSRTINPFGIFRFSRDGLPRNGLPTIQWDPSYLTRDGLLALVASTEGVGLPELLATQNNARPPVNDQVSLGIRQQFGVFQASITGSYQRGRNGYTYIRATRGDGGNGPADINLINRIRSFGYADAFIGFDGLDTRYKALFVTLDKNYTETSGWGVNIAYTLSKGEQNGDALFSLDEVTPDAYGWRPRVGDERHRVVISGIVDLPLGFQFSTLSTFGSGQAYRVDDVSNGSDPGQREIFAEYPRKNCIKGIFAFCEVNLTLSNRQNIFGQEDRLELAVDLLNAFDNRNFTGFDGFIDRSQNPPDLLEGVGTSLLTLPRRLQFRASYRF